VGRGVIRRLQFNGGKGANYVIGKKTKNELGIMPEEAKILRKREGSQKKNCQK